LGVGNTTISGATETANLHVSSVAGTNLKRGHKSEIFLGLCPFTFLALQVQLVFLMSTFIMVGTVLSVSCMLFFYSWGSRAQPSISGGHVPPCPIESAPLHVSTRSMCSNFLSSVLYVLNFIFRFFSVC